MGLFTRRKKGAAKGSASSSAGVSTATEDTKPEEFDFMKAFSNNLEYISRFNVTTEEVHKLFSPNENQTVVVLGEVNLPSGEIVVADPLCYLFNPEFARPLNYTVRPGSYPVALSIHFFKLIDVRIIAAKLRLTDAEAVRYEVAMPQGTSIEQLDEPGILPGFGVDAGMGSFCDKKTAEKYAEWISEWHKKNPGKNHYEDYFAAHFKESYTSHPDTQREGGDYLLWTIPQTEGSIALFASGLGDGFYQSFWGFDTENHLCELVIPLINPDLFESAGPVGSPKQYYLKASDIIELLDWDEADGCLASDRIMVDGCKVGYMYREAPSEGRPDSGWRFLAGDENEEYLDNLDLVGIYQLNTVANYDPDIIPFLQARFGSTFIRGKDGVLRETV